MMQRILLTFIIIAGLGGCASTTERPSITYYLLDQAQTPVKPEQITRTIGVEPVFVAEYLSVPNLLLKQANHQLTLANYHLWAEPLAPSIKRALVNDLSVAQPSISFVDRCANCDVIRVYVDHFYPEEGGHAVLSGRYSIKIADGTSKNYPFSIRTTLSSDGYAAAVQEMRSLVQALAKQISSEL